MSWTRTIRVGSGALAALAALACGSPEPAPEEKERASWSQPGEAAHTGVALNAAPRIHSVRLEPDEPASGEPVRAVVSADDPDGDRVQLSFVWHIGGDLQSEGGPQLRPGELAPGELISVEVTASDGRASSQPHEASLRVRNRRPVVTKVTIQPGASVARGQPLTALAEGTDPDGAPLTFEIRWLVNGRHEGDGETFETDSLERGDRVQARVVANDGADDSDPILTAAVRIANGRPEILSQPTAALTDGEFHYRVAARDPDGSRNLRYLLKQAPEGMTIHALHGDVRWRPGPEQAGKHPVEVVVEDPDGGRTSQTFELTIAADAAAAPAAPAAPAD